MQRWVVPLYPQFERDGWWSGRGLLRGVLVTTLVAGLLALAMVGLAWYAPHLVVDDLGWAGQSAEAWQRVFPWGLGVSGLLGAAVGWVLLDTMQRQSGRRGNLCTTVTLLLAVLVIGSKHGLFAVYGLELSDGFVQGSVWLTPEYLLWYSYGSWVGLCLTFMWWHLTD